MGWGRIPAVKRREIDLGNPKTFSNVIHLMIPAMISQLINVLYNIVDRIYIGNLPANGEISLIGAGVCSPITTLVTSFAYLAVLGSTPLFSMSLGQGRKEDAEKILFHCMVMLGAMSLVIMGLSYLLLRPMLYAFGASEASYSYAHEYMVYFLIGTVPAFFSIGCSQFLIAQGRSVQSMATSISAAALNIALDPLLMYAFDMGIKGAAIATTISWTFALFLGLLFILRSPVKIKPSKFSFAIVWKIIKLGLSPFIILATDSVILIGLNSALQTFSNGNGDFLIECATITQAFFSLVTGPLLGISSGTQAILAYLFGARKTELVKKAEIQITICGLVFTTICFALSFFLGEPFAKLFVSFSPGYSNAEGVIASSAKYIRWYMIPIILLTFQYTLVDGLTGIGQAKYSIWLSLNRKIVLLLPLTFLLPWLSGNAEFAFLAEPIADGASGIVSLIVFCLLFPKILKKQKESTGTALGL